MRKCRKRLCCSVLWQEAEIVRMCILCRKKQLVNVKGV